MYICYFYYYYFYSNMHQFSFIKSWDKIQSPFNPEYYNQL